MKDNQDSSAAETSYRTNKEQVITSVLMDQLEQISKLQAYVKELENLLTKHGISSKAKDAPVGGHWAKLEAQSSDYAYVSFVCHEPPGAACRIVCEKGCGISDYDQENCYHKHVASKECTFVKEMQCGDPIERLDGSLISTEFPVKIYYSDGYIWETMDEQRFTF